MSDIQLLRVPKWGLSMEEGTIALWLINEGDTFTEGQEICEIETSKIANVMEAPLSGRLHRIIAHPGDTLPVQAIIAVVAPAGIDEAEVTAALANEAPGGAEQAVAKSETNASYQAPMQAAVGEQSAVVEQSVSPGTSSLVVIPDTLRGTTETEVFASPRAIRFSTEHGLDLSKLTGSGRGGRVGMADVRSAIIAAGGSVPTVPGVPTAAIVPLVGLPDDQIVATPVARRLARSWGIALASCRATGRNGRVCKADVEAERLRSNGSTASESPAAPASPENPPADANYSEVIPMTGMRRTIAARMSQSKLESPHFRVAVDVQVDSLNALRKQINAEHPGVKVSVNDFVIKAVAMALLKHPACNIQFDGEVIKQFAHADVAVAVAMEAGLITPIVRTADSKSLVAISTEMRELAIRAKASTLKPGEFQGGTFTVSNLGMFGVSQFDAIINPPQAAILAVGGAREEVRFRDGQPVPVNRVNLNLASDHRVIDGALAAAFLQTVKRNLESPIVMLAGQVS